MSLTGNNFETMPVSDQHYAYVSDRKSRVFLFDGWEP